MIGKVNKLGTGFKGVASYLEHGRRDALEPDRVDWIESRNLPTRDPQAAARIMAATARDSDSVQRPVYHFSISFDPDDPVNRETMRQVAERTLRDLGLQEHQALILAHRDRAHAHVHVVVNRVHPERLKVWNNWHDYRRIERSLREQEAELGLRVVPGRHAPTPERVRSGPEHAPGRRLERGDAAFVERVRREAAPHLIHAQSWDELERGLAEHGLSVRVDGRGLVVTDGVKKAKASEIDRAASRASLERRLGALGEYRARQAVAARTLDERAPEAAPARVAEPVRIPPAKAEHRRIAAGYREGLARLYDAPREAHARFRETLMRDGREAAVRRLRETPEAFGRVRGGADAPQRARAAAQEAYRWSGRMEAGHRLDVRRAAAAIREHEAIRTLDAAEKAVHGARDRLSGLQRSRHSVRTPVRSFAREAAGVYKRPREALHEIARSVQRIGAERTADLLHARPEHFGALQTVERKRYLGLATEHDPSRAREAARSMSGHLRGLDAARAGAPKAGEMVRARAALEDARKQLAALPARGGAVYSRAVEMHRALERAGKVLHTMERAGVDVLARMAPTIHTQAIGLVRQAASLGRSMAMGVDPERDRGRDRGGLDLGR